MLDVDRINVHYGKIHALRDVSLKLGAGEVAALIGPNAAGKTTTLRTIVGLKAATSGAMRLDGEPLSPLSTSDRVRRGIALVPEGRQLFPKFSVIDNLIMGAFGRADRDGAGADLDEVFGLFPRLAERRRQSAGLMSGGEQQMLAIGRGLMAKPKLLLLDEPTLGLAPIVVEEIEAVISRLAARGISILLAEQNAAMAMRVSQRVYVVRSGRIALEGTPAELARSPDVQRLYLGT